jgi:hypothetical protein
MSQEFQGYNPEDAEHFHLDNDNLADKTLENATPLEKDEKELVEELHVALHGGMARDTLDNKGRPFTGEILAESAKHCDELIDDPKFQALLMKL